MSNTPLRHRRRRLLGQIAGLAALLVAAPASRAQTRPAERPLMDAAFAQKALAESWGDQPYGAVLVLDGRIVGEGPSRVVKLGNPDAHAEREAIRDAQQRMGRKSIAGAVLYSTSRPCRLCERAAAQAGVALMIFGAQMQDGGKPSA
jgi:tRNA(Arg) A34 adenosine deaminase TadA